MLRCSLQAIPTLKRHRGTSQSKNDAIRAPNSNRFTKADRAQRQAELVESRTTAGETASGDWRLHGSTSKHQDKCNTGGATWILSVNTAKGSTAEFPSTKIVCTSQVVLLALGASIHSRYSKGINAVPVTCSLVAWRINVNGTGKRVTGGGKCCVEECGDALDTRSTNASHHKTWHVRSSTSPRVVQTKKASSCRRTTK